MPFYDYLTESMAGHRSKSELERKICPVCGLPFTWRKKWANCWDEVRYCSERCRRHKHHAKIIG